MKITNNPSFLQKNISFAKIDKKDTLSSTSKLATSSVVNSTDALSVSKMHTQTIGTIGTLQQEHVNTQRLFGTLTLLSNAIQLFQEAPSKFKENLEQILADMQTEFPQEHKKLEEQLAISGDLGDVLDQLQKDVSIQLNSQKKEITYYLIQEQNKDAVAKKAVSPDTVQQIGQQVAKSNYTDIHKINLQKITTILN